MQLDEFFRPPHPCHNLLGEEERGREPVAERLLTTIDFASPRWGSARHSVVEERVPKLVRNPEPPLLSTQHYGLASASATPRVEALVDEQRESVCASRHKKGFAAAISRAKARELDVGASVGCRPPEATERPSN